jgi:uncharacterized phage protein gp47/JayE
MPWKTPTLRTVREAIRGEITTSLGRASFIGNSVLRIMADAMAAMAHLTLRYLDWLALQFLPDTAEMEWLDRHGDIWLVNADGSKGRKVATFATGEVTITGVNGAVLPAGSRFNSADTWPYETTEQVYASGDVPVPVHVRALNAGAGGNRVTGDVLSLEGDITDIDGDAPVTTIDGGVEPENDDQLRARILRRIQQPPMGGAAYDYEAWALAVPGVTRAWAASEVGIGTVTTRFMMDDMRADNDGIPYQTDVDTVEVYIASKRPVAVKDFFVVAPVRQEINCIVDNLIPDTEKIRAEIEVNLQIMLRNLSAPGQTIFAALKSYAVMNTTGVVSFQLGDYTDDVMASPGHIAILGGVIYEHHPS